MDFHLTVCSHLTVAEAHLIADHLEQRIEEEIPGADVTIHIEPCPSCECPADRKECESLDQLMKSLKSAQR
jgi:divalent metal cation (Fe/Co/Zn/Cd) transporter